MVHQDMLPKVPDFIELYSDVLDRGTCSDIIARFEADDRKRPSWSHRSAAPKSRSGMMLSLPEYDDWQDVVEKVGQAVMLRVQDYAKRYPAFGMVLNSGPCKLTHPLLERIEPGQGFDWHIDGSKAGSLDDTLSRHDRRWRWDGVRLSGQGGPASRGYARDLSALLDPSASRCDTRQGVEV